MSAKSELAELNLSPVLFKTLQDTVFPGATDEAIRMAVAYCQARNLDILSRVVYLVPMYTKVRSANGSVASVFRDVVMPGIALHRINATRTGTYLGLSDTEYGPPISTTFPEHKANFINAKGDWEEKVYPARTLVHPEWVKVVAKRSVNGGVAEFPAKLFWMEIYAKLSKSERPNDTWMSRPYGQADKCAEAAALRKGFPECCADVTAEEADGKAIEGEFSHVQAGEDELKPKASAADILRNRTKSDVKKEAAPVNQPEGSKTPDAGTPESNDPEEIFNDFIVRLNIAASREEATKIINSSIKSIPSSYQGKAKEEFKRKLSNFA
jgi:phage recombination protein Bet